MTSEFTISALSIAVVVLLLLLVQGGLTYRTLSKQRNLARAKVEQYRRKNQSHSEVILRELDTLFKLRTGLSNALIALAAAGKVGDDFRQQSTEYMQASVDALARILLGVTGAKCAVSIKLLTPNENSSKLLVRTYFRDALSARNRASVYEEIEPYEHTDNTMIKYLIEQEPKERYIFHNDLTDPEFNYSNPNKNWRKIFSASAIHVISNPDSEKSEEMYGFLCVDCTSGVFNEDEVRPLLSIISTAIYYCVYATSSLEHRDLS